MLKVIQARFVQGLLDSRQKTSLEVGITRLDLLGQSPQINPRPRETEQDDDGARDADQANQRHRERRAPTGLSFDEGYEEADERRARPADRQARPKRQTPPSSDNSLQQILQSGWSISHGVPPCSATDRVVLPASQVSVNRTAMVTSRNHRHSFWRFSSSEFCKCALRWLSTLDTTWRATGTPRRSNSSNASGAVRLSSGSIFTAKRAILPPSPPLSV